MNVKRAFTDNTLFAPTHHGTVTVWEVVFSMMVKMGVPDRVWKLQPASSSIRNDSFIKGNRVVKRGSALSGVVQRCSLSLVEVACITGCELDGITNRNLKLQPPR